MGREFFSPGPPAPLASGSKPCSAGRRGCLWHDAFHHARRCVAEQGHHHHAANRIAAPKSKSAVIKNLMRELEKIQSPPWPACENLVHASRDLSKFWFRVCPASQQRFVGTEEIPEQVRNKIVNAIMSLFLRDDSLLLIRCESWVEEVAAIFVRGSVSRQENCNHTHHK